MYPQARLIDQVVRPDHRSVPRRTPVLAVLEAGQRHGRSGHRSGQIRRGGVAAEPVTATGRIAAVGSSVKVRILGVGMGPQHVTPEVAEALRTADYVVAAEKADDDPLLALRRAIVGGVPGSGRSGGHRRRPRSRA